VRLPAGESGQKHGGGVSVFFEDRGGRSDDRLPRPLLVARSGALFDQLGCFTPDPTRNRRAALALTRFRTDRFGKRRRRLKAIIYHPSGVPGKPHPLLLCSLTSLLPTSLLFCEILSKSLREVLSANRLSGTLVMIKTTQTGWFFFFFLNCAGGF